jgi:hypothetical protein
MQQHPSLITALISTWAEHRRQASIRRHIDLLDNHLRQDAGMPPIGPAPRNPFTEGW